MWTTLPVSSMFFIRDDKLEAKSIASSGRPRNTFPLSTKPFAVRQWRNWEHRYSLSMLSWRPYCNPRNSTIEIHLLIHCNLISSDRFLLLSRSTPGRIFRVFLPRARARAYRNMGWSSRVPRPVRGPGWSSLVPRPV